MNKSVIIACGVLSLGLSAGATDCIWVGQDGGNWSESANWQGGTVPNGAGDVAIFNGAGGNVVQDVSGLVLGGLTFSGIGDYTILTNASNYPVTLAGEAPAISVAPAGRTATFEIRVDGKSGDAPMLTKAGAGTVAFNQYVGNDGWNSRFKGAEVQAGTVYLGFPENSDGFGVQDKVIIRSGAVFRTGRNNQVVNWVNYAIDAGGLLDGQGCGDCIGTLSGAGVATNFAATFMPPYEATFTGRLYGNVQIGGDKNSVPKSRWIIGASNTLAVAEIKLAVTNALGASPLAFAPGIGTFALRTATGSPVDLPFVLEDTDGKPVTLLVGGTLTAGQTMNASMTGKGSYAKDGPKVIEWDAVTNSYAGATRILQGTLKLGNDSPTNGILDSPLAFSTETFIASNATLTVNNDNGETWQRLSGSGTLTKNKGTGLTISDFAMAGASIQVPTGSLTVAGGQASGNTFTWNPSVSLTFAGGTTVSNVLNKNTTGASFADPPVLITGGRHHFTLMSGMYKTYRQTGGESVFDNATTTPGYPGPTTDAMQNVYLTLTGGSMTLNAGAPCRGIGFLADGPGTTLTLHNYAGDGNGTMRVASDGVSHTWIITNGAAVVADNVALMSRGNVASTGRIDVVDGGRLTMQGSFSFNSVTDDATRVHLDAGTLVGAPTNSGIVLMPAYYHHTFTLGERGACIRHDSPLSNPRSTSIEFVSPLIPAPENVGLDGGLTLDGNSIIIFSALNRYAGPTLARSCRIHLKSTDTNVPVLGTGTLTLLNAELYNQGTATLPTAAVRVGAGAAMVLNNDSAGFALASLVREGRGTLMIYRMSNTELGGTSKVTITDTPAMAANGLVLFPVFCDQPISTSDRHRIDLLTYDAAAGLTPATFTEGLAGGAGSLASVSAATTLSDSASVYALRVGSGSAKPTLTIASGKTLTVGDGTNPACVILNSHNSGGIASITGGTLAFGTSEGVISGNLPYQGAKPNEINSAITGTGGLTLAPTEGGWIKLGATNTYTGGTVIQSGRVSAGNASSFGAEDVTIQGGGYRGGELYLDTVLTLPNPIHVAGNGMNGTEGAIYFAAAATLSGSVELTDDTSIGSNVKVGTISGPVTGPGALKLLSGWLALTSEANTYTGATTVATGATLSLRSLGAGPIAVAGTLRLENADALTVANTITGAGVITLAGAGRVKFLHAEGFTGQVRLDNGTVDLAGQDADFGAISGAGLVTNSVATAVTLTADSTLDTLFSGTITDGEGTIGLTKTGSGLLVLTGTNAYTGVTAVEAGRLQLGLSYLAGPVTNGLILRLDASAPGTLTLDGTNVTAWADADGRAMLFKQDTAANQPVLATNALNGLDAVYFPGVLQYLAATNSATYRTVLIANRVATGAHPKGWDCVGIFGKAGQDNGIRLSNATRWQEDNWPRNGLLTVNSVETWTFKAGETHVLGVSMANAVDTVAAIGDYWHSTTYRRSYYGHIGETVAYNRLLTDYERLQAEAYLMRKWMGASLDLPKRTNVLDSATAVSVAAGAALDLNGADQELAALTGAGEVANSSGTASLLTVGGAGTDFAFDGVISGSNTLVKVGAGVMTLGGASTYSGATRVEAGTLRLAADDALPAGTVLYVAAGATFDLNGHSQTVAAVTGGGTVIGGTLGVTGYLAPGGEGTIGTLTFETAPAIASGCELRIDTQKDGACDVLAVGTDFNLANLALKVATPGELAGNGYTVLTCGGQLAGAFASATLPAAWKTAYEYGAGEGRAKLLHSLGTVYRLD